MKTLKLFMAVILAAFVSSGAMSQAPSKDSKVKSETIKVSGKCDMCKARIEKAAKLDGVENASWDSKTQLLTVSYDPSRTNTDAISKKVAAAGHDAGKIKAEDKSYNSLPACCKYGRTAEGSMPSEHSGHHMNM